MKFGIVSYERKKVRLNGRSTQNMGDWVQTLAVENLYHEWGIKDYVFISRNDMKYYDGEYVIIPYNGYNTLINKVGYEQNTFPISDKIIPVFFSMHFHDSYIPASMLEQLKTWGSVGCRDEYTMKNLRKAGISCYLSGCLTATFPKRDDSFERSKIVLVDAPTDIKNYMPLELQEDICIKTHCYPIPRTTGSPYMTDEESKKAYQSTKELLEFYRDEARLIITSRLHVASPCLAMGIPVILVAEDFDERFSWIDQFLPLYRRDDWENINWNPKPIDFEPVKEKMKVVLRKKLFALYEEHAEAYELSTFWENRKKNIYNAKIREALSYYKNMELGKKRYAIWGVVEQSLTVTNTILEELPEWKLEQVIDLNVSGEYNGIEIKKPNETVFNKDILYIIMATKARNDAVKILSEIGAKYIFVDRFSDRWVDNFE